MQDKIKVELSRTDINFCGELLNHIQSEDSHDDCIFDPQLIDLLRKIINGQQTT
jgi:hypothetical protein